MRRYTRHELTTHERDLVLLEQFYRELYCDAFADADERESQANMIDYLQRKAAGWYGRNNYHILLLLDAGRPVAGSISDYLDLPCVGMLEFLVVAPACRRQGLGRLLLDWTEQVLAEDAARASAVLPLCIAAEMHYPGVPDSQAGAQLDARVRARVWRRWGYARLAFDYVQPPLSDRQHAVTHLWLIAKCPAAAAWPAERVRQLVHEYLVWAMRIAAPLECPEYRQMEQALRRVTQVDLVPLPAD